MPRLMSVVPHEIGAHTLYLPGEPSTQTRPAHQSAPAGAQESAQVSGGGDTASAPACAPAPAPVVRSDDHHRDSAPGGAQTVRRAPRAWPILLLALPAFVAIWSGWVGLGQLTGFGPVRPLPGIWDRFTINTAITLPIGMEAYASYALYVWLSGRIGSHRTRNYAKYSAFGSLALGATGQVAYHLMRAAGLTAAPWPVTVLVACLPVAVLGMGAALAHMMVREHHDRTEQVTSTAPVSTDPAPATAATDPEALTRDEDPPAPVQALEPEQTRQLEAAPQQAPVQAAARDRWVAIAEQICGADPSGRRDIDKVTTILRLKFDQQWSHSRIAETVELSRTAVTRTVNAARDHLTEGATPHDQ